MWWGHPREYRKVRALEWLHLDTLRRRGGTSLGSSQAGPAYATGSAAEEFSEEFDAQLKVGARNRMRSCDSATLLMVSGLWLDGTLRGANQSF